MWITRVALAMLIAICAQAGLQDQVVVGLTDPQALTTVFQQVVVGVAIGLAVRIVFASVELAGEVIGLQMGLNYAGFFDPSTNSQSSAVGRFFGNTTMLLFVVLNGQLMLVQQVLASDPDEQVVLNLLSQVDTHAEANHCILTGPHALARRELAGRNLATSSLLTLIDDPDEVVRTAARTTLERRGIAKPVQS